MGGWLDWIDWGDAPTWFAGVFAAGAAFYARGTLKSQQQQIAEQRAFIAEQSANLALERAELRAAADDREWAQAKQVSMVFGTAGSSGQDRYGDDTGYDHWWVEVRNGSDAPVRHVRVRFGGTYDAAEAVEVESERLPDGGRRVLPVALIGAGRTVVFRSPRWQETTVDNNRPDLFFTDEAGVKWRRDQFDHLEELP